MAQVQRIEFVDDWDGKPIEIADLNQVTFAVDGIEYRLELRPANFDRFMKDMTKWTSKAAKVGKAGRVKVPPKRNPQRGIKLAEIREWAKDNGYEVSDRGRLPAEVESAYHDSVGA